MLNTLISGGGTISAPTKVHLTCVPDPPNAASSGLSTAFTMSFDADATIGTYCEVYENGVFLGGQLAAAGAISILVANASFGGTVTITGKCIRANQATMSAWPRSAQTTAPESIVVPP